MHLQISVISKHSDMQITKLEHIWLLNHSKDKQTSMIIAITLNSISQHTLLIKEHLAISANPTMFSGDMNLVYGNPASMASCVAKAVLPHPAAPRRNIV